jgi:hypothetical protein
MQTYIVGMIKMGTRREYEAEIQSINRADAIARAESEYGEDYFITDANPAPLTPESSNWENTVESFLCRN